MTLTPHGHHIHGTTTSDEDRHPERMRCGGPGICKVCASFAAGVQVGLAAKKDAEKAKAEGPTYLYN